MWSSFDETVQQERNRNLLYFHQQPPPVAASLPQSQAEHAGSSSTGKRDEPAGVMVLHDFQIQLENLRATVRELQRDVSTTLPLGGTRGRAGPPLLSSEERMLLLNDLRHDIAQQTAPVAQHCTKLTSVHQSLLQTVVDEAVASLKGQWAKAVRRLEAAQAEMRSRLWSLETQLLVHSSKGAQVSTIL